MSLQPLPVSVNEAATAGKTACVTVDASNLRPGTYRIVFRLGEAICNYSIIVSE